MKKPATKKEMYAAKKLSLKVWKELKERGCDKNELECFEEIEGIVGTCPLCQLYYRKDCRGCPLFSKRQKCVSETKSYSWWQLWKRSMKKDEKATKGYATKIYDTIKAWEIK